MSINLVRWIKSVFWGLWRQIFFCVMLLYFIFQMLRGKIIVIKFLEKCSYPSNVTSSSFRRIWHWWKTSLQVLFLFLPKTTLQHKLTNVGTLKKCKWEIPECMKVINSRDTKTSLFGFNNQVKMVRHVSKST